MKNRLPYIYLLSFIVCAVTILFVGWKLNHSSNLSNDGKKIESINKNGMNDAAANISQKLAELKREIDNNPQDTLKMKEYANLLGGVHNDREAAKVFENILLIGPNRIDVMLVLTYIYFTLGNTAQAEEYTHRVLTINKDNPEAIFNLGIIELKKGNKEKAKQILNSVINKFPNNNVALYAKSTLKKL